MIKALPIGFSLRSSNEQPIVQKGDAKRLNFNQSTTVSVLSLYLMLPILQAICSMGYILHISAGSPGVAGLADYMRRKRGMPVMVVGFRGYVLVTLRLGRVFIR